MILSTRNSEHAYGPAVKKEYGKIYWKNASESDELLLATIAKLFRNDQNLLSFFFHFSQAKLSTSSEEIKKMAMGFGSGQDLLVRIALDIWSEEGGIYFNEIYQKLDNQRFDEVLKILQILRGTIF